MEQLRDINPVMNWSHGSVIKYSDAALEFALKRIHNIWRECRKQHDRFSIYQYLAAVFELGMIWKKEKAEAERATRALKLSDVDEQIKDPFAVIIRCTSHAKIVDKKMRSKWTRVLIFAAEYKKPSERLEEFIRRHGGINRATAKFARRLRRPKNTTVKNA